MSWEKRTILTGILVSILLGSLSVQANLLHKNNFYGGYPTLSKINPLFLTKKLKILQAVCNDKNRNRYHDLLDLSKKAVYGLLVVDKKKNRLFDRNYPVKDQEVWLLVISKKYDNRLLVFIDDISDGYTFDNPRPDTLFDKMGILTGNGLKRIGLKQQVGKGNKNVTYQFPLPDDSNSKGYKTVSITHEEYTAHFMKALDKLKIEKEEHDHQFFYDYVKRNPNRITDFKKIEATPPTLSNSNPKPTPEKEEPGWSLIFYGNDFIYFPGTNQN